jgi:hypothetical protein
VSSTSTTQQIPVRITKLRSDHVATHPVTFYGTAPAGSTVVLQAYDRHRNRVYTLAQVTSGARGNWSYHRSSGFLYNTQVQGHVNQRYSNVVKDNVHQVLRINNRNGTCHPSTGRHCSIVLVRHDSQGYHYVLKGHTKPGITGEFVGVIFKGRLVGGAKENRKGGFTIQFTLRHKTSRALKLSATGTRRVNGSTIRYDQPTTLAFRL